jgi:hypothetical protein
MARWEAALIIIGPEVDLEIASTALLPLAVAPRPTAIVIDVFVTGSIRVTVSCVASATQIDPSPTAIPAGLSPTPVDWATPPLAGSIRSTVVLFATQIAPSPAAAGLGRSTAVR